MRDQIIDVLKHEALWGGDFLVLPKDSQTQVEKTPEQILDDIRKDLGDCKRCPLSERRNHIVFGEGNPEARIMFVGEAPGAVEDKTGKPFVGPAGRLFTDIVEKGMGLKRSDVYIANILKCRPPGNRDPLPTEVSECIGFLKAQILAIRPEMIIALGRIAAQNLLETKTPISRLRGNLKEFMGTKVMPTYHPSYLLQNPSKKRDVWEDIKAVLRYLDLPLPR
ncbi:MAG: uracil-DNA glycosylase [Thermodesulfobacteriota bacterium]|nr:uracil-DNA glycosylase [Thermodesulfobacteriota bacterium]